MNVETRLSTQGVNHLAQRTDTFTSFCDSSTATVVCVSDARQDASPAAFNATTLAISFFYPKI
ncbi:hypothetical protein E2C01_060604 [Portunus trituberculatus]|uniref:Uncharacterized protein n=1 Tax=Portunus trituberculatus TaxID=210409 RepID=A0A5B7H956_PORTR|nr:hypothetical protein [Portunus trituberculatus]